MPDDVAIIAPTLGRPHAIRPLIKNFIDTTPRHRCKLYFVVDRDDIPTSEALKAYPAAGVAWIEFPGTYPQKINAGVRATSEALLLLTSDDIVFHPGWLDAALRAFSDEDVEVVGTNDLSPVSEAGDHSTQPMVTRSYIKDPGGAHGEQGTAMSELYHHNFCETELCQLAQHRGVWSFARECVIEHRHPAWGTAEIDDTYRKGSMQGWEGDEALFTERKAAWSCESA